MKSDRKSIQTNNPCVVNVAKTLGDFIRAERSRLGISQEELAEASGLHRTYIGVVERGEKNITVMNCYRIALALGVQLSDLLCVLEKSHHSISSQDVNSVQQNRM